MDQSERELVTNIKQLFQNCKLKECINIIDKLGKQRSFLCHKTLQYYKGICLFEIQQQREAQQCFDTIIEECKVSKENSTDELDVLIRIMYQFEVYYTCSQKAEVQNDKLLKICEQYKSQLERSDQYNKGVYLFGKGMYLFIEYGREQKGEESTKLLQEALNYLNEFQQEILISLGWMYYIYQKIDLSCKWHQTLYEINPRYPSLANNYAITLHEKGKNGKAEELFLEEEKLRNNNQISLSNIAQFYFALENIGKEREYYDKLFALTPKTSRIYHKYGQYLMRIGKRQKGLDMLYEGLNIDPDYCPIYQDLSDIEFDNQNYQKAIEYIKKCIDQYPHDGYYKYRYGVCLEAVGRDQEAIGAYRDAINQKNYLAYKIYSNAKLGIVYLRQNQNKKCLLELMNTCNYKSVQTYSQKGNIVKVCSIINTQGIGISLKDKIEMINDQYGFIVTRYDSFATNVHDKNLKQLFLCKLDTLRAILLIISYRKYIEHEITFQKEILFWDLFLN